MTDDNDNVRKLPERRTKMKNLDTVEDGKAITTFDADGNMRRMAGVGAQGWRDRFIESFSEEIQQDIKSGKISPVVVQRAQSVLYRMLEEESWRLVFEPPQRPIYQKGELVGFEPVVQTKHVEWMLERHLPERYHLATKTQAMSGAGKGITFKFQMGDNPGELEASEAEFEEVPDDAA